MVSGWRAEKADGGLWCAVKTVREDFGTTTAKVRKRRVLDVPREWRRGEVQAHINALVRRGELV